MVFTSSTTSSEVVVSENLLSSTEDCSPLANPSLSEFIGPLQMEMNNEDPFCFYYIMLAYMYCDNPQTASDYVQCAYYNALIIEKGCIEVIIQ